MGTKDYSTRITKISEPVSQNLLARVRHLKNQGIKIHDFSKQKNVPNVAIKNAVKSLKSPNGTISTEVKGSLDLRKVIAKKAYNYNSLDIDPEKNITISCTEDSSALLLRADGANGTASIQTFAGH